MTNAEKETGRCAVGQDETTQTEHVIYFILSNLFATLQVTPFSCARSTSLASLHR